MLYLTSAAPDAAAWLTEAVAKDLGVRAISPFKVPRSLPPARRCLARRTLAPVKALTRVDLNSVCSSPSSMWIIREVWLFQSKRPV